MMKLHADLVKYVEAGLLVQTAIHRWMIFIKNSLKMIETPGKHKENVQNPKLVDLFFQCLLNKDMELNFMNQILSLEIFLCQ